VVLPCGTWDASASLFVCIEAMEGLLYICSGGSEVKRVRLKDAKERTDVPAWEVVMMVCPVSNGGRAEMGINIDAGESAWTFGEG